MRFVMLAFPGMTHLDLIGPYEVFARSPEFRIITSWKKVEPIPDPYGMTLNPSVAFEHCPPADLLFVPGGPGQIELMRDQEVLGFLREQAGSARWITSVCTGSLLLGAAGLLQGRRATCHWQSLQQLSFFGCHPTARRVVIDGNLVTGAGITSGIDFALTLTGLIFGEERAQLVQLAMEYDPDPPFNAGSPRHASDQTISLLERVTESIQRRRRDVSRLVSLDQEP